MEEKVMKNKTLFLLFFVVSCALPGTMFAMSSFRSANSDTIEDLIEKGDIETLDMRIKDGTFDVNAAIDTVNLAINEKCLYTPLELAVLKYPNPAIVRFLLKNGANTDSASVILGEAIIEPLHGFVPNPVPPAIVGELLNHGANRHVDKIALKFYAEQIGNKRGKKHLLRDLTHNLREQAGTLAGSCSFLLIHGYSDVPEIEKLFSREELAEINQRREWAIDNFPRELKKRKEPWIAQITDGTPFPTAVSSIVCDYQYNDGTVSYFNEQEYLAEHPVPEQHDHGSENCVIS
jgi:hypothetical protein